MNMLTDIAHHGIIVAGTSVGIMAYFALLTQNAAFSFTFVVAGSSYTIKDFLVGQGRYGPGFSVITRSRMANPSLWRGRTPAVLTVLLPRNTLIILS